MKPLLLKTSSDKAWALIFVALVSCSILGFCFHCWLGGTILVLGATLIGLFTERMDGP